MEQLSFVDILEDEKIIKQLGGRQLVSNDWDWELSDLQKVKKNNLKVFSCFACGGGSSLGYKLAGYDVIGCCEIDKRINDIYVKNNNPKYNYVEDIRDFNQRTDLPKELFNLDILDGSPPCSTFSMSGLREDAWGKEKKFREGQKKQVLDDLPFVFIDTVAKLRPKVVLLENVEGMVNGDAWKYVQEIHRQFNEIGYKVKHWIVKGETMGVPQIRHRVIFIATRLKFDLESLDLHFNYKPILFKDIKSERGTPLQPRTKTLKFLLDNLQYGELDLSAPCIRLLGKRSFFNNNIVYDDKVCNTLTAKNVLFRYDTREYLSRQDMIRVASFPRDFDFIQNSVANTCYICGMSVPPIMIKRIAERLYESKIFESEESL